MPLRGSGGAASSGASATSASSARPDAEYLYVSEFERKKNSNGAVVQPLAKPFAIAGRPPRSAAVAATHRLNDGACAKPLRPEGFGRDFEFRVWQAAIGVMCDGLGHGRGRGRCGVRCRQG